MITTSSGNKAQCEVCGSCPADQYRRDGWESARGARYHQARRNRHRLGTGYTGMLLANIAGMEAWQGKLVCETCAETFFRALNK